MSLIRVSLLASLPVLAAVLMPADAAMDPGADARDLPYTRAQQLVDIDYGRRLNLYCVGQGSPTVVFDAGLGGNSAVWDLVQPAVALKTRACAYDRAGLGFSDPATRSSTSANIVDDLQRLLTAAGIKPPYILVGHSYGGMNMRLYADDYPAEVAGMVLVDPADEDEGSRELQTGGQPAKARWDRSRDKSLEDKYQCVAVAISRQLVWGNALYERCMPPRVAHFSDALNAVILRHSAAPSNQRAGLSELESFYTTSADELRAARRSYGAMPLIVLTHSPFPKAPDETQEQRDVRNKMWETLHDELAALSTRGVNRTVPQSGHFIQWDQPQAVVDAVFEVLAETQQPVSPSANKP